MNFKKNNKNAPRLYGFHAVREAWLNEDRTINTLFLTQQAARGFEKTMLEAKKKGLRRPDATTIEKDKLDKLLPKGAVHQGIALSCPTLEESDLQDFIIRSETQERTVLCILDQVTDPHNVGAILRSASAFGIDGVVMQKKHAPALEGVLAKTACGAVDHIDVAHATNLSRAINELQENGFYVVGLDERGERQIGDVAQDTRHNRLAVVLGSEGDGIRHLIKETCDELIKLPTQGAIASLNVSNAAAVTFYEIRSK